MAPWIVPRVTKFESSGRSISRFIISLSDVKAVEAVWYCTSSPATCAIDAIARDEISRGETHQLLVTTDARRKEVYWALYEGADKDGVPIRIDGPHVSKPADLEELLRERGIEPVHAQAKMSASSLGLLAHDLQKAGRLESDTSALYLRAPDAVEPNPNKPFGKPVSG